MREKRTKGLCVSLVKQCVCVWVFQSLCELSGLQQLPFFLKSHGTAGDLYSLFLSPASDHGVTGAHASIEDKEERQCLLLPQLAAAEGHRQKQVAWTRPKPNGGEVPSLIAPFKGAMLGVGWGVGTSYSVSLRSHQTERKRQCSADCVFYRRWNWLCLLPDLVSSRIWWPTESPLYQHRWEEIHCVFPGWGGTLRHFPVIFPIPGRLRAPILPWRG